jgi:agmatinase
MNEDFSFYTYRKMSVPLCHADVADASYIVAGYPFDGTQTGRTGARYGPTSLRAAMFELEQYDLETGMDLSGAQVCDIGDVDCVPGSPEQTTDRIFHTAKAFPSHACAVGIGGEHSISYPIVKALRPEMVVSFDAHPDLRDDYMGVSCSHSSVMRRIHEEEVDVAILGVREGSRDEARYAKDNAIPLISPASIDSFNTPTDKEVYISIDLDVFGTHMNVGNPMPGGLSFDQVCTLMRTIVDNNDVRGIDIVELCSERVDGSAMLAAKLAYKFIAYDMLKNG